MVAAPRGALTYPVRSREGKEELSLGPMAYLGSKDKGKNSMPSKPSIVPRRMAGRPQSQALPGLTWEGAGYWRVPASPC